MSTNYTEHLGLTLWEADDPVLRTEFNANHEKLDARLGAMPRIAVGSYDGNGEFGEEHPKTLTFDFTPMMVVVVRDTQTAADSGTLMIRGQSKSAGFGHFENSADSLQLHLDWLANGVSWYGKAPLKQFNLGGATYHYFAIGL